jgi:hypothetical protein
MGGTCSKHGGDVGYMHNLVGKPERKRKLGRTGRRWEDNFKLNPKEGRRMFTGRGTERIGKYWMHLRRDPTPITCFF